MALFGTQIVITMIMACILQKLSIRMSFARWLLGNKLYAYMPPSVQVLKEAEGIQTDNSRKKGKVHVEPDYKINKNISVTLDHVPVLADDLSALNFYPEYQWLLDFMAYTTILYGITEVYLYLRPGLDEVNMSLLWCILVVLFVFRTLLSLCKLYFTSQDASAERSMCLVCGLSFLLFAMLVLIVDEKYLDFELMSAYDSFNRSVGEFSQEISMQSVGITSQLMFKLSLAAWAGLVGALLVFPGIRFAQMHRDLLKSEVVGALDRLIINLNFVLPLLILLMWVRPISREYFTMRTFSGMKSPVFSSDLFEAYRIGIVIVACLLRLWMLPHYMQSYLNVAHKKIMNLKREAGRIQISDYRRTVSTVFNYSCVVALQYVAPPVLLLFSTLMLKTLGDYSWLGVPGTSPLPTPATTELPFNLHRVKHIFTPVLFRGLFNFSTWWISCTIFINSILGYAFYSYNDI